MRTLSNHLELLRRVLATDDALLFLVEVPRVGTNAGVFRLARSARHIAFGGKTFQAAGIGIEAPTEEGGPGEQGVSYGTLALGVSNVSRLPLLLVESDDELLGQDVTVYLAAEKDLAGGPSAAQSWTHTITAVEADERVLRVECGHPATQLRAPGPVFDRSRFPGMSPGGAVRLPVE